MPRLQWPDAHHRDLPTRSETQSPGATEKAGRMTRCPSHWPKPKHAAFRDRIALRAITLSIAKAPKSAATRPPDLLPIISSHALGSALLFSRQRRDPQQTPADLCFPHGPRPASAASSFQGLSTRAAQRQRQTSRCGPHRKTFRKAEVRTPLG